MNRIGSYFRSDLARECIESYSSAERYDRDGIRSEVEYLGGMRIDRVEIVTREGAEKVGKEIGRYTAIEVGELSLLTRYRREEIYEVCVGELSRLLVGGSRCLVACLGNRAIAADSQGPLCAESLLVTRHLKENAMELFTSLSLFEVACIVPDVLGNTGVESSDIIREVSDFIRPDFIIAVDSLATSSTERLGRVLQISDTGIRPGSGIGNRRCEISERTMGIPVIAMGVPTVADAASVASGVISQYLENQSGNSFSESISSLPDTLLGDISRQLFLTPKNIDRVSALSAELIGTVISSALNPLLSLDEIRDLCSR